MEQRSDRHTVAMTGTVRESLGEDGRDTDEKGEDGGNFPRGTWLALGTGMAAAFVVAVFPLTAFFANFIRTFIHEFGHTVACWFFAHPAAPSFNLATGGGMTVYDDRNNLLLAAYAAVFLLTLFLYRRNRLSVLLLLGGAAAYLILLATSYHEIVILLLGHGAELIVAGMLLYRVLGDERIRGRFRQPVYASLGAFILLQVATFSYKLVTSHGYRHTYEQMRGAGFEMDFTRLAHVYLGVEVSYIAALFFAASLLVPLVCLACCCCRRRLEHVRDRISFRSPGVMPGDHDRV